MESTSGGGQGGGGRGVGGQVKGKRGGGGLCELGRELRGCVRAVLLEAAAVGMVKERGVLNDRRLGPGEEAARAVRQSQGVGWGLGGAGRRGATRGGPWREDGAVCGWVAKPPQREAFHTTDDRRTGPPLGAHSFPPRLLFSRVPVRVLRPSQPCRACPPFRAARRTSSFPPRSPAPDNCSPCSQAAANDPPPAPPSPPRRSLPRRLPAEPASRCTQTSSADLVSLPFPLHAD